MSNYEFDRVDYEILTELQKDARIPYLELARKLLVSGGTIHQRIDKMKQAGVIKGSKIQINLKGLGYDVVAFLGVHLSDASVIESVIEQMRKIPEIIEVHYTTGHYGLLVKVQMKTISDFHQFLLTKLQKIEGVRATESFISLDSPIEKDIILTDSYKKNF